MKKVYLIILVVVIAATFNACKKESSIALPPINKDTTNIDTTQKDSIEKIIEIKTSFGTMYMWLYNETPQHKANFLKLTDSGFYDSTTFHRIIPGFVIQGGDHLSKDGNPANDGNGSPGYTIPAEFVSTLKHDYGMVAAARLGDNVNPQKASSGSQFYIVVPTAGTPSLNGNYTVFGKILSGLPTIGSIVSQPRDAKDRPTTDIKMDVNVITKTRAQLRTEFNFVPTL